MDIKQINALLEGDSIPTTYLTQVFTTPAATAAADGQTEQTEQVEVIEDERDER